MRTVEINLVQGGDDWLAWRTGGIGASEAPTIMGENPWQSRGQLLRMKIAAELSGSKSPRMALGNKLEPEARELYTSITGREVRPVCLQSLACPWFRGSLDGLGYSGPVEIKCGKSAYEYTSRTGCVPGYYYGQLQHIMALTGRASIDFFAYWPKLPPVLINVDRDNQYIRELLERESLFWTEVLLGREHENEA